MVKPVLELSPQIEHQIQLLASIEQLHQEGVPDPSASPQTPPALGILEDFNHRVLDLDPGVIGG
jgi:hypothetical protein